jgi:hypothetical protein
VKRALTLLVAGALLAACGGGDSDSEPEISGDADPEEVRVIDEWASTLASGDVEGAARFFAIPSVAENGITLQIDSFEDAVRFNVSLPCGAELISAEAEGEFTTATFRLIERPGPGTCGDGTGGTAQTSFVIEDEHIVEWRRVGLPGEPSPGRVT